MSIQKKGFVLWFSGLSGSGKSTVSEGVLAILEDKLDKVELLDGDLVRNWLTKDLWFSREDRQKNLERVTFVAKMLSRNDVGVISAFISPYRQDRHFVKDNVTNFIEVYVNAPLETCEDRDVKGLYAKARTGEIKNFTGISDPYEEPEKADIVLHTDKESSEESIEKVVSYLENNGFL